MSDDPPIPAATLVVMRPAANGALPSASDILAAPDILVVERAAGMAFAGGALVFPGGRIDPADVALARRLGRPDDAARVTAIRETVEESAVLAGVVATDGGAIDPALGAQLQAGLLAGGALDELLAACGLELDLDALVPFARWMPAFKQPRRFDTIFFLAPALPGDWTPLAQPGECEAAEWAQAKQLLDRIDRGEASAIFPTKRNLERVALHASIEEAVADARRHSLETIVPWVERRAGEDHICIPDERGYPILSEPLTKALRA